MYAVMSQYPDENLMPLHQKKVGRYITELDIDMWFLAILYLRFCDGELVTGKTPSLGSGQLALHSTIPPNWVTFNFQRE